ncbi:MAG: DUF123 domain-containing protein [Chlorobiales bacterium]|nr:DUF123 domain-containing protein [Chlorobiales bacterium]
MGPFLLLTIGGDAQVGTYILRISVTTPLHLSFGRFKGGKQISIPPGDYLYIGSALGRPHLYPLARRLLRHASRSDKMNHHPIRDTFLKQFAEIGLGAGQLLPKNGKKLFWNIDYLLDQPEVNITGVVLIRSENRLEGTIAEMLTEDSHTFIVEKGLGANDARGETHFLGISAGDEWWKHLSSSLARLL